MPDPDLSPPESLLTDSSNFFLFSEDWLSLQGFVASVLELPITQAGFEDKYGEFGGQAVINDCVKTTKELNNLAIEFGDPKTLRTSLIEDPNLLATDVVPDEIYSSIIWTGQKVHEAASTIASNWDIVKQAVANESTPQGKMAKLKEYLFLPDIGPIQYAEKMQQNASYLHTRLSSFDGRMRQYNAKMSTFSGATSDLVLAVKEAVGSIAEKIAETETSRDDALTAWKGYTAGAGSAGGITLILIGATIFVATGGAGVKAAVAVGAAGVVAAGATAALAILAAKQRAAYNGYCQTLVILGADQTKKTLLLSDLTAFDTSILDVNKAMTSFLDNLENVKKDWGQMKTTLVGIANSVNESNIGDTLNLVFAKSKLVTANWTTVSDRAQDFTINSLIDFQLHPFGQELPDDKAA